MAADKRDDDDENEEQEKKPAKSSKKRWIMLAGLVSVLVVVSVGGTVAVLHFLKPAPSVEDPTAQKAEEGEKTGPAKKSAIYYPLTPAYVINIEARGRRRFMRLDISLMTRDDSMVALLDLHRPSIDNIINQDAAGQLYEDIQTPEGKELLRQQLTRDLQAFFKKEVGKPGIEQVLFTNFVIQ